MLKSKYVLLWLGGLLSVARGFSLFGLFGGNQDQGKFLQEQRELVAREQRRGYVNRMIFPELESDSSHLCVNRFNGKSQSLYASRVLDGVCDCCDGSDEVGSFFGSVCGDTCELQASAELAEARKRKAAYSKGKLVRDVALAEASAQLASIGGEANSASNDSELDEKRRRLAHVENVQREKESAIAERVSSVRLEAQPRVAGVLGLASLDARAQVGLLIGLVDLFGVDQGTPMSLPDGWEEEWGGGGGGGAMVDVEDEEATDEPQQQMAEDEEDGAGYPHDDDERETMHTDLVDGAGDDSLIELCRIVRDSGDSRLLSAFPSSSRRCRRAGENNDDSSSEAVHDLVLHMIEREATAPGGTTPAPYQLVQMLMVYYRLNGEFGSAAVDFARSTDVSACESTFTSTVVNVLPETVRSNCDVAELLVYALQPLLAAIRENTVDNFDELSEIAQGKETIRKLREDIDALAERQRAESEKRAEFAKFDPDFLEYAHIRDVCVEKKDGQYVYKVCLGASVDQSSASGSDDGSSGGSGGVSLGSFDRIEHDATNGGAILHYSDGKFWLVEWVGGLRRAECVLRLGDLTPHFSPSCRRVLPCFWRSQVYGSHRVRGQRRRRSGPRDCKRAFDLLLPLHHRGSSRLQSSVRCPVRARRVE